MVDSELGGVLYYPVTPFDEDGNVSEERMRMLVRDVHENADLGGVFPLGSTGEFAYLTLEERKHVAEITVDEIGGELPVIVGASAISTQNAVEIATHADEIGADGVMVNPQSYYSLTLEEVYRHYEAIDDAISIDLIAYNNPGTTGIDMDLDTVRKIAELENVRQFKASSGDLQFFTELHLELGDDISLLSGSNPLTFEMLSLGAVGWSTAVVAVAPRRCVDFFEAVASGDMERGRELFMELYPLLDFLTSNRLSITVKAALRMQGIDAGEPRPPLRQLPPEKEDRLESILSDLDLLSQ